METLPDYLAPHLDMVFVGINLGLFSAQQGHYFADLRNRFWTAFNAAAITPIPLAPETDHLCLLHGLGFTDIVKRPTRGIAELKPAKFTSGPAVLEQKLLKYQPCLVCFNGIIGYRAFLAWQGEGSPAKRERRGSDKGKTPKAGAIAMGLQQATIGTSRVWVLPSTSPANAGVSLERIIESLRAMKTLLQKIQVKNGS